MRKKILKIFSIIFIILCALCLNNTISNAAASFDASISKTSVNVGDTFTVTVNANNAAGNYSVSASNSNVTLISGSATEFLENGSATLTYKAVTAGTVNIVAKATDMTDLDNSTISVTGSKTFTVTISTQSSGGNTSGNTGGSTGGSTGGTTSGGNTNTTPTAPTFKDASKTVYTTGDINLRASWSTSSAATQVSKGTELRLTGTSTEKVNGYVWYRVTYNGQIKYVAKDLITEKKPEEKSNNTNLKSLSIEGVELTPTFSSDITEYSAKLVNFNETYISVIAEAEDEKSIVRIAGDNDIKVGENIITATVTAEDGTSKIYKITVVNEETTAFGLANLTIKDIELKEFSTEKYDYEVNFEGLDKLEIKTIATEDGATIEILGNENLVEGENIITIIVTSADEEKIATYQIKANKLITSNQEQNKQFNIKNIIISAVIALVILIIIIVLIVKYVRRNDNSNIDYIYEDNLNKDEETVEDNKEEIIDEKEEDNNSDIKKELIEEKAEDNEVDIKREEESINEEKSNKPTVDDLFSNYDDEEERITPKRRGKGKHSK